MTRETKIGLLVGLAFIIVIGILLSDHLTSTSEPAMAPLAQAGESVREGVGMPGVGGAAGEGASVTSVAMAPPSQVSPQQPVLTRQELTTPPTPAPVQIVKIGGPAAGAPASQDPQPVNIGPSISPAAPVGAGGEEIAGADSPIITRTPAPSDATLTQVAQQHGEELVTSDGAPVTSSPAPSGIKLISNTQVAEYVAQPGDSLSRMASKLMGSNSKDNRQAIIDANPSLKADPNKVIAGKKYLIPIPGGSAPTAAVTPAQAPNESPSRPAIASSSQPEYWYTVKEGDNLWKIAESQLGDGTAYTAIKELNKDTLKGGDTVTVNMKLRLPARPVASAQ